MDNHIEPVPADADDRLCFTGYDNAGVMTSRSYGPNSAEKLQAHVEGRCDALCGHCYAEACSFSPEPTTILP